MDNFNYGYTTLIFHHFYQRKELYFLSAFLEKQEGQMDGWRDGLQSYQDSASLIMKGCVLWNSVYN